MAQNEMRAKPALPERVRSMEGLGRTACEPTQTLAEVQILERARLQERFEFWTHKIVFIIHDEQTWPLKREIVDLVLGERLIHVKANVARMLCSGRSIEQDCLLVTYSLHPDFYEEFGERLFDEKIAITGKERRDRHGIDQLESTIVELIDARRWHLTADMVGQWHLVRPNV